MLLRVQVMGEWAETNEGVRVMGGRTGEGSEEGRRVGGWEEGRVGVSESGSNVSCPNVRALLRLCGLCSLYLPTLGTQIPS